MVRRLIDIFCAALALCLFGPLLLCIAIGIRLTSRGPVLYRGHRAGLNGRVFLMYKFRTMRVDEGGGDRSAITAHRDPRVFPFGTLLRALKLDELPQLCNILKGEMSFIGPRPEDPRIVEQHYAASHWETLQKLPGLASPGSIYNYTHGERWLTGSASEAAYVETLLPLKLALDTVYVRQAGLIYDVRIALRALFVIFSMALGKRRFPEPPELPQAKRILQPARRPKGNRATIAETKQRRAG